MLLLLALSLALAGQRHAVDVVEGEHHFTVGFTDEAGAARRVEFVLPSDAVRADVDAPLGFPRKRAVAAQVQAVRRYAETVKGPKVTAKARGGGVAISVSGRDRTRMRAALDGAEAARDAGLDAFLAEEGWVREGRKVLPDHVRFVEAYTDDVAPVAAALAEGLDLGAEAGRRAYADRAVRFVQAIPYERRKGGGDKGYRRPLAVLARNRGDCDSKTVLYLALVRAALPDVAGAVVYVPGHAFAAVGVPAVPGDAIVRVGGERLVLAEPVGPKTAPLGDGAARSKRRALLGLVRAAAVEPAAAETATLE